MLSGPDDAIDLQPIRRVLVVKLRHHGDVLLSSPVFSVLRARAPRAEIDALVYEDTREMLSLHPAISQVHGIDRRWKSQPAWRRLACEWALLQTLRRRRYDLLIHLTEHTRGAWLARLLGVRHAVAPGYRGKPAFWKNSFSHRFSLPLNPRRHMVEVNLDALRRIGVWPEPDERRLCLVPGDPARERVAALLQGHGIRAGRFIHLHPTSRWQFKCWPAGQVAALCAELVRQGEQVVITAAPAEAERRFTRLVLQEAGAGPLDLTGQLTLKELAALSASAALFVGVDSAPMHIAAAVGTPVVALFGPSGEAEWGPWGVPSRVVSSQRHACRPCGIDGCGGSKVSDCLVSLAVQPVLEAIGALRNARDA